MTIRRVSELGAPARLAAFAVALAAVGGLAALAGAATSHGRVAAQPRDSMGMAEHPTAAALARADGLATTAAGFTFVPERSSLPVAQQTDSASASSMRMVTSSAGPTWMEGCGCT